MDIRQSCVQIRAKRFDRTCDFYRQALALPELDGRDDDDVRRARFQAGSTVIEVLGRPHEDPLGWDESFDFVGPKHKLKLVLEVPSAEKAYETLHFRDKNIPGGLHHDPDGTLVFTTHDPDGVSIDFRESGSGA